MNEWRKQTRNALAIVIGRAGSKGLPGKNALPLAGRPMICHTIEHAQQAACVRRVVVSTDGDEIAHAAYSMGATVIRRPGELAHDTASVGMAVRHAVETAGGHQPIIVVLYANVPVRPRGLIDRAVQTLLDTEADSVQSYADVGKYHPYWMQTLDQHGHVTPFIENTIDRRQDLPRLYVPDGGVIVARRSWVLRANDTQPHCFLGYDRRGIENPPGSVVDVDTAHDLRLADAILTENHQPSADFSQSTAMAKY